MALSPLLRDKMFQTPVPALYVPCDVTILAVSRCNSPVAGNVSVSSMPVAVSGPSFVTVTVKVIVSSIFGVASFTVFSTRRSAVLTVKST